MTRTSHFLAEAHIPVYSIGFLSDDVVIYAGGGGAGRSGVTNAVIAAQISLADQAITQLQELKLSRDEDAPMSMAVNPSRKQLICGINNPAEQVKRGLNESIRIFDWDLQQADKSKGDSEKQKAKEKITELPSVTIKSTKNVRSLDIDDPEQYQKVTVFSPAGRLLAVGSTDGKIALQRYPSLSNVWKPASPRPGTASSIAGSSSPPRPNTSGIPSDDFFNDEIYDADFSETASQIVFTSSSKLVVYSTIPRSTPETPEGGSRQPLPQHDTAEDDGEADGANTTAGFAQVIQTIKNPALGGNGPCSFRSARFGRGDASREKLFTVVNALPAKGRGPKAKVRKSFVTAWDADSWDLIETRHVSDRPVTVFDVSPDGRLLAYGSSDLSVGVLDAKTLRPILKILHAHDFPPTSLRFNPSSSILVSASADNTLRIIQIPPPGSKGGFDTLTESRARIYLILLLSLLMVVLALVAQKRLAS